MFELIGNQSQTVQVILLFALIGGAAFVVVRLSNLLKTITAKGGTIQVGKTKVAVDEAETKDIRNENINKILELLCESFGDEVKVEDITEICNRLDKIQALIAKLIVHINTKNNGDWRKGALEFCSNLQEAIGQIKGKVNLLKDKFLVYNKENMINMIKIRLFELGY